MATWQRWAAAGLVVIGTVVTGLLCIGPWDSARGDVGGYAGYAAAFWHGIPPFHSLPHEYPPPALLPFSITLAPLAGAPITPFVAVFGLLFIAGYLCCLRFASPRVAARYTIYLLLGAQGTLLDRYDLAPALLTLAALWCAERRRFGWAYLALAAGAALKLYPLALLPIVAIANYRDARAHVQGHDLALGRAGAGALSCALLATAATFAPSFATGQSPTWLTYATTRPVQVESVAGTLVWLGSLVGVPVQVESAFGSQGFIGPLADSLGAPLLALGLAGYAWACWRQIRGELSARRAALAALCLILLVGKVFSAQYVIWVLPVAALAGGLEGWWVALAILTSLDYPILFPYSHGLLPLGDARVWSFLLAVAARNALLLFITARLVLRKAEGSGDASTGKRGQPSGAVASGAGLATVGVSATVNT